MTRETLPPMEILAERRMLEDARPRFRSQRDLADGDYSSEDPLWAGDLLIPFLSRRGVEGMAYVGRSGMLPSFTDDEVAFLLSLGQQAGTSIERQRAREEARLRGHHLEALNRLGASFARSLDLETVCQGIYDEILTFTRLDHFAVALTEDDDGRVSMPFAMEGGGRVSGDQSVLLPPALVRHALREGEAVVSRLDSDSDPEIAQTEQTGARHCLIAPMMRDNRAFGVLSLQRKSAEGFTPDELHDRNHCLAISCRSGKRPSLRACERRIAPGWHAGRIAAGNRSARIGGINGTRSRRHDGFICARAEPADAKLLRRNSPARAVSPDVSLDIPVCRRRTHGSWQNV